MSKQNRETPKNKPSRSKENLNEGTAGKATNSNDFDETDWIIKSRKGNDSGNGSKKN